MFRTIAAGHSRNSHASRSRQLSSNSQPIITTEDSMRAILIASVALLLLVPTLSQAQSGRSGLGFVRRLERTSNSASALEPA